MVDELTTQVLSGGGVAPAGVPDNIEDLGETETAALLDKINQGGEDAGTGKVITGALDDPGEFKGGVNQPEPVKPKAPTFEIPDKFKGQDGALNQENIVKSYGDLESSHGKVRSQLDSATKQMKSMTYDLEDLQVENEKLKQELETSKQPELSEEDQELMRTNPTAYAKKLNEKLAEKSEANAKRTQREDSRMNATAAECRANLPGFQDLEKSGELDEMSKSRAFSRHPDAIPELYYAAVGRRVGAIQTLAREQGEKAGYERAKSDLSKHVEVGGKSSAIADIGAATKEQIDNASEEELAAMTPNHGI